MNETPRPVEARSPGTRSRAVVMLATALALVLLASLLAHRFALERGRQQLVDVAASRLEVEAGRLDAQIDRFSYLPSLLEASREVMQLLESPAPAALQPGVNRQLLALNAIAGADNLYVLNQQGDTLAAADAERAGTPLGSNLAFRPYVRDALLRGQGRFYGVGVTSGRAGYYLAYALPSGGTPRGVAVVKIQLEALERPWSELPGETLVVDEHQVVILTSRAAWKYRPLEPLSDAERAEARDARRYAQADLQPLSWPLRPREDGQSALVRMGQERFVLAQHRVNQSRWRMLLLLDEAPAWASARAAALSAGLGTAVVCLLGVVALQRRRALRARLASREALQAAHDSLERKVAQRTAELQAAQADLVHAGQLAVLGQVSAGLAHELNQPLAALRTLSDNARVLVERGRLDEARGNLDRIGHLVGRLARLTSQLKILAHKSPGTGWAVDVRRAIDAALQLHEARLRDDAVELRVEVQPVGLAVLADDVRLEQVLVNLIGNALDALAGTPGPRIDVTATRLDAQVQLVVRNSGPPIEPELLARLFQPFVTTKPAGKGLGLGLMISAHMVRGFGGTLEAANLDGGGGVAFTLRLPAAQRQETVVDV